MMQKLFLLLSLSAFIAVCYAAPTKQEEELLAKVADILGAAQEESQAKANLFPSNAAHASQLGAALLRGVGGYLLNRITNPRATANQFHSLGPFSNSQQDVRPNLVIDYVTSRLLNAVRNNGNKNSDDANAEIFPFFG